MKKSVKLITVILTTVLLILFLYNNTCFATADLAKAAANGSWGSTSNAPTKAKTIMGTIIQVTRIITAGIAAIIIFVLASKYMMASPEGKADIKKTAITYFIGALVMFSASGILTIIDSVAIKS